MLPPKGALAVVPVVPLEPPNANGVAPTPPVGAVVVEPPPNVNGAVLAVVVGFPDEPKENIFSKIL